MYTIFLFHQHNVCVLHEVFVFSSLMTPRKVVLLSGSMLVEEGTSSHVNQWALARIVEGMRCFLRKNNTPNVRQMHNRRRVNSKPWLDSNRHNGNHMQARFCTSHLTDSHQRTSTASIHYGLQWLQIPSIVICKSGLIADASICFSFGALFLLCSSFHKGPSHTATVP